MAGPKRGSGPRAGLYSENKATNWGRFDPFVAEAQRASEKCRGDGIVEAKAGPVPIFESALQPGFHRPFSTQDVAEVLSQVPSDYLRGLAAVFILGGTAKQKRAHRIVYGMYHSDRIYLHPLAEHHLKQVWTPAPKPSVAREYTRFGAAFAQESGKWVLRFTPESLRLFYLYDVLLHEVGHHVEQHARPRSVNASERYATWFANYQSLKLLRGDREQEEP